jgi:hypothetical protein
MIFLECLDDGVVSRVALEPIDDAFGVGNASGFPFSLPLLLQSDFLGLRQCGIGGVEFQFHGFTLGTHLGRRFIF